MQPVVFDRAWFGRHQRTLLWLLRWRVFRWVLRIQADQPIVAILPHAYAVRNPDGTYTADFRTHAKYAKLLRHAFAPLWWALHAWDWTVADRWCPAFSAGFSTLTAYPDPGTGATTVCGVAARLSSSDFSTIQSGAGTTVFTSQSDTSTAKLSGGFDADSYSALWRGIFTFDTSPIGGSAAISAAVFSLYGTGQSNGLGSPDLDVAAATPAANNDLASGDYSQCGSTSFGSIAYAGWSSSAYNDITLDSNGQANISKIGITKFSTRLSWDLANSFTGSWVIFANTNFNCNFADQTGTTNDPKLVVTYAAPNMTFILIPD
jgi:hypothetical protein